MFSKTKKRLSTMLVMVLILTTVLVNMPMMVHASSFEGGDGSAANPYLIADAEQLNAVRNDLSAQYKLTADIDLTDFLATDGPGYNSGMGWEPIGTSYSVPFRGTFDGAGHTISNLWIERPSESHIGLFGYNLGALIKDVGLINVNVTGDNITGSLAGYNSSNSLIENSYATGTVAGNDNMGGLVGYNISIISNSYAKGNVKGDEKVGGLVGTSNSSSSIVNSYATGNVEGRATVGGLVGAAENGTIENSYATGNVDGTYTAGGLAGYNLGSINNSYFDRQMGGPDNGVGIGQSTESMKNIITYSGWDFDNIWGIAPKSNDGYPYLRDLPLKSVTYYEYNEDADPFDQYFSPPGSTVEVIGQSQLAQTGYTFTGWNTQSDGNGTDYTANDIIVMGTTDVALYAQWQIDSYLVTFDKNGGDVEAAPTTMDVNHGGNLGTLPTPPTRAEYTFAGWNTDENGDGDSFDATTAVLADITVYAQWQIDSYLVTFDKNGGDVEATPTTMDVNHGGILGTLPTPPTRAEYTFAGWNTDENGDGDSFDATTAVLADITVYAQWQIDSYLVTFDKNGGDTEAAPSTMAVNHGGNLGTLPTPPTRAEYTFAGWNTDENGDGDSFDATTAVLANITVYAQWTMDPIYIVTYHGNGNTGGSVPIDNSAYAQGVTVSVYGNTNNLVKVGFAFAGWNTQVDGSGTKYVEGTNFTMGTTNVMLFAQWTANSGGGSSSGGGDSSFVPVPTQPGNNKVISSDGKLTIPVGDSGEVSLENAVTVILPAGAFDKELILTIEKVWSTQQLLTEKDILASPVYEILKSITDSFKNPFTLSMQFDMDKVGNNQKAVIFYYDEVKKTWIEVGGTVDGEWITAEVDHLTKFAVFAVDQVVTEPEPSKDPVKPKITFSDITGHWAEASIQQAVIEGIIAGYPNGTFKPNQTVTRAEFVVMLANALKLTGDGVQLTFTDATKIGTWSQQAISQAVHAGIIRGYDDGSFRPDAQITRVEMAEMIRRALNLVIELNAETSFSDEADIPTWAKGTVAALKKIGIIQGKGGNQFDPDGKTTRGEAVTVLLNMLGQLHK